MAKDQIAATAVLLIAVAMLLNREDVEGEVNDRLGILGLTYALVLFWRPLSRLPVFGVLESMATDFRSPNLSVPTALITWGLFLFVAYSVCNT